MASFSLFDFYNTLDPASDRTHSEQVDGDLTSRQRWALAVTVASFAAAQNKRPPAELAQSYPALIGLPGMAITRPLALPPEAGRALLWWRGNPEQVRALENPLARADGLLQLAEAAYRGGDNAGAYHQLMLALREGYMPVREQLQARDQALAAQLAQNWQSLRGAILGDASNAEVIASFQQLRAGIARARARLEPPPGTQSIYRWALLLFAAALALGGWLWFRLRRRLRVE
jgi:high-affinity iron transporter